MFRFPSKDYFLKFKPKYTKQLTNASTANCTVCSAIKENVRSLVRAAKQFCSCGSHACPDFWCVDVCQPRDSHCYVMQ